MRNARVAGVGLAGGGVCTAGGGVVATALPRSGGAGGTMGAAASGGGTVGDGAVGAMETGASDAVSAGAGGVVEEHPAPRKSVLMAMRASERGMCIWALGALETMIRNDGIRCSKDSTPRDEVGCTCGTEGRNGGMMDANIHPDGELGISATHRSHAAQRGASEWASRKSWFIRHEEEKIRGVLRRGAWATFVGKKREEAPKGRAGICGEPHLLPRGAECGKE